MTTGNYINHLLSDKSMKFCIMVDHDLTNDFNYDSKQNRSQNYLFLGKVLNINSVQRLREMGKIFVVSMHIC